MPSITPVCCPAKTMAFPLPPRRRRPPAQHGRVFYTTVFVISLLACYSIVRSFAETEDEQKLVSRSFEIQDQEVRSNADAHGRDLIRSSADW